MPVVPCPSPCPPITRGVVVFDAPEFVAIYPEFTGLTNPSMQTQFNGAVLLLDNTCASRVQDANKRLQLLYMLTAHMCILNLGINDGAGNVSDPQGIVGRIADATEGSVSVSAEYASTIGESLAFFSQTKYGAMFWQATKAYRTAHYIPAPDCGPNGPGFPFGFGWFGGG